MLLALLPALLVIAPDSAKVYSGQANALAVSPPRLEVEVTIDGSLDEPAWGQAALLNGFSQFSPTDGVPAADSTQVLVWYSPTAVYFGIRAFEAHGEVHATLADRDRIGADDHVQLLLGTFNDGRQATLFAVNPFGVQADGALVETGQARGGGAGGGIAGARDQADLSPDYVFESKGRLTDYGYEVELRIPFKSLRYQPAQEQTWQLNVLREVQHSGYEDSWAPARRASASFLQQSGQLVGLTDLQRGLVLDLNPVLTARATGVPAAAGWHYDAPSPELSGNVRWGLTNNLTLNGTANPDFSQVESDAGQVNYDPRQALFFPEKRPFFLDGIEQFNTPNNLIYTRRIVQPVGAVKLTGKALGSELAFLSAVDDRSASATGLDHPIFNLVRVQRDLGSQARVGIAYTDRIDGDNYNRVAGFDTRFGFGGVYNVRTQLAGSRTRRAGVTTDAPLWYAAFNRNGRTFGWRTSINAISEDFRAQSGFISRPGIVRATITPLVTLYPQGSFIQSVTGDINLNGVWQYHRFVHGRGWQDRQMHFDVNSALRGGWQVGATLMVETFGYDSALYAGYAIELPRAGGGADTVAFTGTPGLPNRDWQISISTPEFARFSGSLVVLWGKDDNFFEWASADIVFTTLNLAWRPTDQLRVGLDYVQNQYHRRTDRSLVGQQRIPRLKVEYQLSRPLFLRVIGEYNAQQQDNLRDDSRTNAPLLIFDRGSGTYVRATAFQQNTFRTDLLLSYQPTPGTVLFAGYGSTLQEPEAMRFRRLSRIDDGFFVKMSYLFRV